MNITPNEEQLAILQAAGQTKANMLISARAGAAKTTTLEMIAANLPQGTSTLSLAFNKDIQREMVRRLPDFIECKTINALGHRIWSSFLRVSLELDKNKTHTEATKLMNTLGPDERADFYDDEFFPLKELVSMAKQNGYVPEDATGYWKSRCSIDELLEGYHTVPSELTLEFLDKILIRSLQQAQKGVIDFDDQVMLPCIAPVSFPMYKLVLVDEAQDLSPLNHFLISKIVRKNRLIAVGDPFQAIYAFRGADTRSMENLNKMFSCENYVLTTNYRCGETIIESVKWRAPDIKARPNALEGIVTAPGHWDETMVPDGSAIICRNNAPLFRMAVKLLSDGRYPEFRGRDVIKSLVKTMRKLGKPAISQAQAEVNLEKWKKKQLEKSKRKGYIRDQAECMSIFIKRADTLGNAIRELEDMVNMGGRITLTTGHKSKGLEFNEVFFLDRGLINMEEEQDRNLAYVIQTRARDALYFVDSDNYLAKEDRA